MEKISCELCREKEENGSLELYAYKSSHSPSSDDFIIRLYLCYGCAEKINKFIEEIRDKDEENDS